MYQFKKSFLVAALLSTGLGVDARSLWSSHPATHGPKSSDDYILKTSYPIGNGRLGGILDVRFGVFFVADMYSLSHAFWPARERVVGNEC